MCGDQEGSGQDEQVSVQGDDLTMLSDELIPDVPSDYSGLHPADALSLVSDARRLGLLQAYISVSSGSATALLGVVTSRGFATILTGVVTFSGILPGILGGAIPQQSRCLLQRSVEAEVDAAEIARATSSHLQALDVLGNGELLLGSGSRLVLDTNGEDGEVGNLHCDALEHQLSDARYHVGNHTLNRSSRKWGVVTCHVIYELVDVVGLSDDRIGEELAIGIRHLLIDVLF